MENIKGTVSWQKKVVFFVFFNPLTYSIKYNGVKSQYLHLAVC